MTSVRIGRTREFAPGTLKRIEVDGTALCIAHVVGGGFYAVEDRCTHENVELSDGTLLGTDVECPLHGSLFDVTTGEVCGLPAEVPVRTYDLTVTDGDLVVDLAAAHTTERESQS